MPETKESTEVIHRIAPSSSSESQEKFDELVRLLESGTDAELNHHLESFHHSDLADAFGLLDRTLRKRLVQSVKLELDPDLLFELEDHLRKEITDSLTPEEVAEVITEMESDEAVQVLEDMEEDERAEVLSSLPRKNVKISKLAWHFLRTVLGAGCRLMWSQSGRIGRLVRRLIICARKIICPKSF